MESLTRRLFSYMAAPLYISMEASPVAGEVRSDGSQLNGRVEKQNDGSQLNGRFPSPPITLHMAAPSAPHKCPLSGALASRYVTCGTMTNHTNMATVTTHVTGTSNDALRIDAAEHVTHDEAACGVTSEVIVTLLTDDDSHDAPIVVMGWCDGGCLTLPITLRQCQRRVSVSPLRDRRLGRRVARDVRRIGLLRLPLARCGEICLSVERNALLLRLPCCRNERDLSIVEIPARTHYVTREVTPEQRTNERLAHLLTIGRSCQLLSKRVRRHDVGHSEITSLPARLRGRDVTRQLSLGDVTCRVMMSRGCPCQRHTHRLYDVTLRYKGQRYVIPANSDIRCYADGTHTTHDVVTLRNASHRRHARQRITLLSRHATHPPPPHRAHVCCQNRIRPRPRLFSLKFSPTYPRIVFCSTTLREDSSA